MCFGFDSSECSKTLIGAYSIQNNGVLNQIAVENQTLRLIKYDASSVKI